MIRLIVAVALLVGTAASANEAAPTNETGGDDDARSVSVTASDANAAKSFTAMVSGALEMQLKGAGGVAGAKWGQYHINMTSDGKGPRAMVAFHRADTTTPAVGTYPLGEQNGFRGTIELHATPERVFQISAGDLIITEAGGKTLAGRFTLTAREMTEAFTETPPEITVEGTFRAAMK
jgi:hypothetical protein